ncbi:lamin tail domain-containing protein [Chitinophaga agri]|uniref:Lamin tail domain-containing protein n=1 Tax=Chitinophaga agri TaxID=2703787 RepID=A0A6B9ZIZ5_9BACT|nr:lamin tail domain-containing protein [Chitinophaga agri]QHS61481.1 lamin tail domain-containing protein [Chitinophaga agri]
MRITIVCACLLLQVTFSYAQVSEKFDYQSINEAVSWNGTDTAWSVEQGKLRSHLQQASTGFYLSTPSSLARNAIWEWWLQLDFNTSSLNYTDVFLIADSANLLAPALKGYFVRIGNTKDDICLYRKDGNTTPVLLIDGRDGITDHTSSLLKIKVSRKDDDWELWTDENGSGSNYVREGIAKDNRYNTSRFMGFAVRQSTASFFRRHYFDDISVSAVVADTTPPSLLSVRLINDHTLSCCFSEIPDSSSISNYDHFYLSQTGNTPLQIRRDSNMPACINVQFSQPFPNGDSVQLYIKEVTDLAGNTAHVLTTSFLYYLSTGYDVLIHEFLPRALPSAGLLPARFVELKNNSPFTFQLKGWRIGNGSRDVALSAWTFTPGSYLIVCDRQSAGLFPADAPVMGISSFPAPGDSDFITLRNDSGMLVHAVAYDRSWYDNPVKEKGGWSLEMVDVNLPCAGASNWRPSLAKEGGTPGRPNTVSAPGTTPPPVTVINAYAPDSMTVILSFSGIMDSMQVSDVARYRFEPQLQVTALTAMPPLYNSVSLRLSAPLLPYQVYAIAVDNMHDCTGQPVTTTKELLLARAFIADSFDIVFNEILYDPAPGVPEFVEVRNRSRKAVDLRQLFITRRKTDGGLDEVIPLSATPRLLLPGNYAAFTTSPASLCLPYDCWSPDAIYKIDLPALINEEGTVVLLNAAGQVIDELHYSDKMHAELASNTRGVSLERLQPDGATQDAYNWRSAASTVKYATPGRANSRQLPAGEGTGMLAVQPAIFSPDNDGLDDLAVLHYQFPEPGYIINVTIFDAAGRKVRLLERNTSLPAAGYMTWDGRGENNRELVTGIYIIFAQAFSPAGEVRQWKLPVVLGKKLNS